MTKQAEIDYMNNIGAEMVKHAVTKPYSDSNRGGLLMEIGAVLTLMPSPPATVLDCGCGTGWTSCLLARCGFRVTGLDIAPRMIEYAEINKKNEGVDDLTFVADDFETCSFDSEFDCVLFFGSLHHSEAEDRAVKAAYDALKPGGILIASEPGLGHQKRRVAIDASRKYGVTERDMRPSRIIAAGRKAGFGRARVYPRAEMLSVITYPNESYAVEGGLIAFVRKWLLVGPVRTLAAIFLFTIFKRFDGIVVMRKGLDGNER
jgi:2-polyprenyl-3-methyl-5-hydroxy-6-metoxy-1,4-benzoquinol methylase